VRPEQPRFDFVAALWSRADGAEMRGSGSIQMRSKMTILIVDDHPSFRVVAKTVLETDGFAVVGTAIDGESAVDEVLRVLTALQSPSRTFAQFAASTSA